MVAVLVLVLVVLAKVVFVAVEEVRKYAQTVRFMAGAFGVEDRLSVRPISLYQCNAPEFYDRFDLAHCPGVIYHVSDPVLALRILFNSLRVGGVILLESAGLSASEPLCRFWGNIPVQGDAQSGWAWFHPSPAALARMMKEAGFDQVQALWHAGRRRILTRPWPGRARPSSRGAGRPSRRPCARRSCCALPS